MKLNHIVKRNMFSGLFRSRYGTRGVLVDLFFGFLAFLLASELTPYAEKMDGRPIGWIALGYALCVVFSSIAVGVPMAGKDHDAALYEIVVMSFMAVVLSVMIFALLSSFLFFTIFGRYVLLFASFLSMAGMILFRWLAFFLHHRIPLRIYLAGATEGQCAELKELFREKRGFRVVCCSGEVLFQDAARVAMESPDWLDMLQRFAVDTVILCQENDVDDEHAAALMELPLRGIDLFSYGSFMETFFKRIPIRHMSAKEVAAIRIFPGNDAIFLSKRLVDVVVAFLTLLFSLPIWLFALVAIKLDSPGPVFFIQERDGAGDRTFSLIKFRTMRGAEAASTDDDHRITAVGQILRKTRIDELPQLINVLKGDMSLVGPRPECSAYTQEFKEKIPYYSYRRLVKPGLTGWAQMRFRYSKTLKEVEQKFQYDLYYIRHMSFRLDMCILMKTLPLLMRGSR